MRRVRAVVRLVLFVLVVLLVSVLRGAGRLVLPARADRRWRGRLFRFWARTMWRVLGMRVTVRGAPPSRPFFLVTNHLGYVDVATLAGTLDATFIAKADVRAWPLIGWAVAVFDTIFIKREKRRDILRVNEEIAQAVACDEGLVLFAEGTSSGGDSVLPLKPSLLEWPAAHARPVHYGALHYRTRPGEEAARTAVCWWGERPFFPHLMGLLAMPGFEAVVAFGAQPVTAPDRKRLAEQLHDLIEKTRQESATEGDAPPP